MGQRILQMPSIPYLIRAYQDPVVRVKAATLPRIAAFTSDIARVYRGAAVVRAEEVDVVFEEADEGGVGEEPGCVAVAARDVAGFGQGVAVGEVLGAVVRGGAVGEDGEEGGPGVEGGVEGSGGGLWGVGG